MLAAMQGATVASGCSPVCCKDRVPPDFLMSLRAHGMPCPIRGINDPRLDYPELLISGLWKREDIPDGRAYRYVAAEDRTRGLRWEQYFEVRDDHSYLLRTVAGNRTHEIEQRPDRSVAAQVRPARADD